MEGRLAAGARAEVSSLPGEATEGDEIPAGAEFSGPPEVRSSNGSEAEAPWPTEGEEAAFLAEASLRAEGGLAAAEAGAERASARAGLAAPGQAAGGPALPRVAEVTGGATDRAADAVPLPKLDDLVARIPAPVRETLDELFRAKFIAVRRYPGKSAGA